MIRHARHRRPPPLPIALLPVAVVEPTFRTSLISAVGPASLLDASVTSALAAAIAMSAITMRADVESRLAPLPAARSLAQHSLIMNRRVPWSSWTARQRWALYVRLKPGWLAASIKVYRLRNPAASTAGFVFRLYVTIPRWPQWLEDQCAFGADDAVAFPQ